MIVQQVLKSCFIAGMILFLSGCGQSMSSGVSTSASSSGQLPAGDDTGDDTSDHNEAPPATSPTALTHGKDLTAAMVGPAAIGFTSLTNASGATINNASSASYIKAKSATAVYDGITVTGAHLLIEGMNISGNFDIYSSSLPVVIRGCKIRGSGYWAVNARDGAKPVYLLYSDLGGSSASSYVDTGFAVSGNASVALRNRITNMGDGFSIGGKNVKIMENLVTNFAAYDGAHNDGLQATGANDGLYIARNKIILDSSETGAINLGPWAGVVAFVTVDSNYLAGGGWTFYGGGDDMHNVSVTNNIFGFDQYSTVGYYGVGPAYWANGAGNVWSNNKKSDGTLVTP